MNQKTNGEKANGYIRWAAVRAFGIAIIPLPFVGTALLKANEAYMIRRIGRAYGCKVDKSALAKFLACLGGGIGGLQPAGVLPCSKAPMAAMMTCVAGRVAREWLRSEMTLPKEDLKAAFNQVMEEAKMMNRKEDPVKYDGSPGIGQRHKTK